MAVASNEKEDASVKVRVYEVLVVVCDVATVAVADRPYASPCTANVPVVAGRVITTLPATAGAASST